MEAAQAAASSRGQAPPSGLQKNGSSGEAAPEGEASGQQPPKQDHAWVLKVLQPGKKLYDGHGIARPSAFIASGPRFVRDLEVVMADRGGPGSWMWKKLPRKPTQGLPRPPGGAAALPMLGAAAALRQEKAEKRAVAAAAKAVEDKRQAKKQRMVDLRNEFLEESRLVGTQRGNQQQQQQKRQKNKFKTAAPAGVSVRPGVEPAAGASSKGAYAHHLVRGAPSPASATPSDHDRGASTQVGGRMDDGKQGGGGGGRPSAAGGKDSSNGGRTSSHQDDMAAAREQALAGYRLMRAQQQRKEQQQQRQQAAGQR